MTLKSTRRRILLSAFACSSEWGSEPGVGWNWLLQLARIYDVTLLTHAYFRPHIEPALKREGVTATVHYLQAPAFGAHPHWQLNSRLYYTWWQWLARGLAKRLLSERKFDLIHHLTWGTIRLPCFLTGLGVPLVMGPLGGGEAAPLRLFRGLPWHIQAFDLLRSLSLQWVRIDPLAMSAPRLATLVLCRSQQSLEALPASARAKAAVVPEIGSPPLALPPDEPLPSSAAGAARPRRILFAGRLLGWKGVAIALNVVDRLVAAGHDVRFDIAGAGPLRRHLEAEIARLGLGERVRMHGAVPRAALLPMYAQADLFLFPSLHDSGGTVVLEALSRGLPVVCVDLGGPPNYVDATCGAVVKTEGLDRTQLEAELAAVVGRILNNSAGLAALKQGAATRAVAHSWAATVRRSYELIEQRLSWSSVPGTEIVERVASELAS